MKFNEEELVLLESALEHAIDDVEHYLKNGDPEANLPEEDLAVIRTLPDRWRDLSERIQSTLGDTDEQ